MFSDSPGRSRSFPEIDCLQQAVALAKATEIDGRGMKISLTCLPLGIAAKSVEWMESRPAFRKPYLL
jgi:hypothetical protein